MGKDRVSFSGEELSINQIEEYFDSTEKALRSYYHHSNPVFAEYSYQELTDELDNRIAELNRSTTLMAFATIEAHLRIDFLKRCYYRYKDDLSRKFREVYSIKGSNVSLSDDILRLWMGYITRKSHVSDLISALNYRHWLAHGRYWVAKLGRTKYDFREIVRLAILLQSEMNIDMGA
jgi:hypothetical protein